MKNEVHPTRKKHSFRSFITGMLMGAALVAGAYFTYLIVTNDEQTGRTQQYAIARQDSMKPLYMLAGFSQNMMDSSFNVVDSLYYQAKWNQLISQAGYREMDSLFLDSLIRKMYFDSLLTNKNVPLDTMVLANDHLLTSKSILVTVQKSIFNKTDTTEDDDYVYSETKYKIEFWESPINFRGYKRSGNYVILYGLLPKNVIDYAQIDNNFFLKENQIWFMLNNTDNFSVLSPVVSTKALLRLEHASRHN